MCNGSDTAFDKGPSPCQPIHLDADCGVAPFSPCFGWSWVRNTGIPAIPSCTSVATESTHPKHNRAVTPIRCTVILPLGLHGVPSCMDFCGIT